MFLLRLTLFVLAAETAAGADELLRGVPGEGPLTTGQVRAWLDEPSNHLPLVPALPVGLDAGAGDVRGLDGAPLTRAKVELGRQLFFDPRLSRDGTVSCATCHDPDHGYASPDPVAIGIEGRRGRRNAPTVLNRLVSDRQFLDGRAESLEAQALGPMASDLEMGAPHEATVRRLRGIEAYRMQFERVFDRERADGGVTIENAARALAAFQRTLLTGPSPWDHHERLVRFEAAFAEELADGEDPDLRAEHAELRQAADEAPLSEVAERGAALFFGERARCSRCHVGANFTDERYHNLGAGMERLAELREDEPVPSELEATIDWGRYEATGRDADRGAFKTPTLRNVAQTAPYLHDGSLATLAEVVAWYAGGGQDNRYRSPLIEPLDLDAGEQADLVAFLRALTGELPSVERGRLPE